MKLKTVTHGLKNFDEGALHGQKAKCRQMWSYMILMKHLGLIHTYTQIHLIHSGLMMHHLFSAIMSKIFVRNAREKGCHILEVHEGVQYLIMTIIITTIGTMIGPTVIINDG